MYQKILDSLKNKYKHLGLGDNYLKVVAKRIAKSVKEESQIEEAVNEVSDELSFAQSEADRMRTMKEQMDEIKKLLEAKKSGQEDPNPNPKPDPETPKPNNGDEVPEWAKTLSQNVTELSKGLTLLQVEKAAQTNQQKLLAQLKESNVPEQFYKYHVKGKTFENDTEITDFANSLKADYDAFKQENANQGLYKVSNPLHADSKTQKGVSSAAQAFINLNQNQNEQSKQGA